MLNKFSALPIHLFFLIGFNTPALALCKASGNTTFNFNSSISTGRDIQIGTILANASAVTTITCDNNGIGNAASWRIYPATSNPALTSSSISDVRNTAIPGVGIRWANLSSVTNTTVIWTQSPLNMIDPNSPTGRRGLPSNATGYTTTLTDTIYFVKTGAMTTRTLPTFNLNMEYSNLDGTNIIGKIYTLTIPTITFSASSCSVNSSNLNINLPTISIQSLPAMGSTSGNTAFNISLTCPAAVKAYITFTDNSNIGQTGNILGLSNSSTSTGIALQIKNNSQIISYGPDSNTLGNTNQIQIGNTSGTVLLPFSVSYIRTSSSTPKAGNLSAVATFTMSYQ